MYYACHYSCNIDFEVKSLSEEICTPSYLTILLKMWPKQDGFIKSQHIFYNNIGTNVNIIFLVDKILKLKIDLNVDVLHKNYNRISQHLHWTEISRLLNAHDLGQLMWTSCSWGMTPSVWRNKLLKMEWNNLKFTLDQKFSLAFEIG